MAEDKIKLILKVVKQIWLAMTEPPSKIIGWTTTEPKYNNGFIDKDSILIFSRMSTYKIDNRQPLEFLVIVPGPKDGTIADFLEEEIDSFTKEGILVLMGSEDIDETIITLEEILIKYPKDPSFDSPVLIPRDIYITMTIRESNISEGKIIPGEKVSLKRLVDIYSTAIGKGLILK